MKSLLKHASILTSSLAILLLQVVTVEATTKCATLTVPSKGVKWELVTTMQGNPKTVQRFQVLRGSAKLDKQVPQMFQASISDLNKNINQFNLPTIEGLQYRFEWILTTGGPYNYCLNSGGECSLEKDVPFLYNQVEKVNIYKRVP